MNLAEFPSTIWLFLTLSAPALLLGFAIAGVVRTFLNPDKVGQWLGRGRASDVILASAVGVPIPLCSCSVIPTAIAIKQKGASRAAVSAFLISTPESGIDSVLVTKAMMDWPMTIIRPVAAFVSAFLAGFLQLLLNPEEKKFTPTAAVKSCCAKTAAAAAAKATTDQAHDHDHDHGHDHQHEVINPKDSFSAKVYSGLKWSVNDLVDDLALWMTIGLVVGAILQFIIPPDFFLGFGVWPSRILCLVVGVPIYICASATTPIAASLVMKGLSPGAALILLLVGPATNVANLAVLRPHLGNKGIIINVFSISLVALLGAIGIDAFYAGVMPAWNINQHLHEHNSISWWEHLCAAGLLVLLARGIWREEIKPRLKAPKKDCCHP